MFKGFALYVNGKYTTWIGSWTSEKKFSIDVVQNFKPETVSANFFFEFLMLFLAVFCGFLAENFRGNYVENERAKELAKNLYNEIFTDSINIQQKIAVRNRKESECAYFISYVKTVT